MPNPCNKEVIGGPAMAVDAHCKQATEMGKGGGGVVRTRRTIALGQNLGMCPGACMCDIMGSIYLFIVFAPCKQVEHSMLIKSRIKML